MLSRRNFLYGSTILVGASAMPGIRRLFAAPATDDPSYRPAMELLDQFRAGTITPREVLEAQIGRIEEMNDDAVNCITYRHFEEARAAADESTRRYQEGNPRPLEGLTIAVKDEYLVEGWVVTMGSLLLEDAEPGDEDAPLIARLREMGAVFHIQTTAPEFYSWATTATRLWGTTRNPWNLDYTPGGSSGGSAAALAAGFTTLALGSDMGGSIRIPSAVCGLYGFKAPFGRIATSETAYETEGPLARSFDDLVLLTNAMVGPEASVHSSLRPKLEFPAEYEPLSGLRIAYDPGAGIAPLDPADSELIEAALAQLESLGVTIERVDIGFTQDDFHIYLPALFSTSMGAMVSTAAEQIDRLTPYMAYIVEQVDGHLGPAATAAAEALMAERHQSIQDKVFSRGMQALVMPTLATSLIPAAHGMAVADDFVMAGDRRLPGVEFLMTWPFNLLSRYPVVNVPVGIGPQTMPVGIQIIGNTFDDLAAFRIAAAYSRAAPQLYTGDRFPAFPGIETHRS